MATIQSNLTTATTFNTFFGPLTLQPGLNQAVNDKLWRNLKTSSQDVTILLKRGVLVEVTEDSQA